MRGTGDYLYRDMTRQGAMRHLGVPLSRLRGVFRQDGCAHVAEEEHSPWSTASAIDTWLGSPVMRRGWSVVDRMHDVLVGCDGQCELARKLVRAKRLSKMTVRPAPKRGHVATTPLYCIPRGPMSAVTPRGLDTLTRSRVETTFPSFRI
jgi:hypothetical protein